VIIVPPRAQHTVSRVVLRGFTWNREVAVYDRERDIIHRKGVGGVFKMQNFDGHDPVGSEERWREDETKMNRVHGVVERRELLGDAAAVATLRDLLAVHWARSPATKGMHEQIAAKLAAESVQKLAHQPELLAKAFTQLTGLVASGPEALDWANRETHARAFYSQLPELFSTRNAIHFAYARARFAEESLQIAYAPDGCEFIIGDVPVITTKDGHDGVGVHQGVAIDEAQAVIMPISPKVLIGLGPQPEEMTLTADQVDAFNDLQERGFVRWLGWKPGGPADRKMRAKIKARRVLA
jgi:hypothetical protein